MVNVGAKFSLYTQPRSPAQGLIPPTVKVDVPLNYLS